MKRLGQNVIRRALAVLAASMLAVPSLALAGDFTQPIKFSHVTHAGKNEVPCEFCHIYARRSITSGIPPVRTCFGCHQVVSGTTDEQKTEIKKVLEYWERQEPIPWKKVHDVPDFVYFSHKRHIQIGFDCTQCHGDVTKVEEWNFDTMKQQLSMGWCVKCHITQHPTANGKIAGPARKTRGAAVISGAAKVQPDGHISGSKDCFICHK
ncbi:MAG: hypothetical protein A2508_09810 [Candidatus Lambdaproteobacteria bacterium RIFOXYD12_FULL_49_8]|uniref:Cytochrome c7-like domain-containing protein n=1 Tax=Candidatus Lambdaproteobacteria bacterium RIFOXYD2_FULL_50_16 TaxID=1817772 RepID=A0A1F6G612_9PROT|nr:MAG: hypothetical protein A2527_11600 [Candidatus Lambdaproteobacteria bacterium RIFOXYD2_FULL_50_16]OGG97613.1 MAG: hypothetical protein A2508_09810 [Candidatus Lambdaproteobacteria bacterium RIFOXYD12_FULL_49_8]